MSLERSLPCFAGCMVLVSLARTRFVLPAFVWLTGFLGAKLLQCRFTGFRPAAGVMQRPGIQPERAGAGSPAVNARRIAAAALAVVSGIALAADAPPARETARTAAREFGGTLKRTLTGAMADGGAPAAIAVCADKAPEIAELVGARHGVDVSRTSLRVRNPANAPTDWQRRVLEDWKAAVAAGTDPATLEFFETRPDGGFHYMKAIGSAPLCVTCHGAAIAPSVAEAIAARYPDDRATGFAPGDLRGAFVVTSTGAD